MSIQKYNRDFFNLPSHIDGFFDNFFSPSTLRGLEKNFSDFLSPTSSISEQDKSYTIHMDLPGVKKDDINIEMKDGTLLISGERKEETKGNTVMNEVRYGKFHRSFKLPHLSDSSKVSAEFKDGQLNIVVEKAEKEQSKIIPVN